MNRDTFRSEQITEENSVFEDVLTQFPVMLNNMVTGSPVRSRSVAGMMKLYATHAFCVTYTNFCISLLRNLTA